MQLLNVIMHKNRPNEHVLFIKLGDFNYRIDVDKDGDEFYIFLAKSTLTSKLTTSLWTNVPKGFIWKPF